eukprot:m.424165 g.424165  ORF g.424165 m.424165 type:complete len:308 (+) comp56669_c0_seq21:104-1027(+)
MDADRSPAQPTRWSESTSPTRASKNVLFAVPKKGRLYEKVLKLLAGAGLDFDRAERQDVAKCSKLPITVVFLPAADIAKYVSDGNVDLGITGQDIVQESEAVVHELLRLNFGRCKVSVQAPVGRYKSAAELAGKRIVTSFPTLTRKFFDQFDTDGKKTAIKFVSGSVEAACGLGLADAVVDLVETGTTMRAAGLEALDVVMTTEAVMIANPHSAHSELVERVRRRIEGYLTGLNHCMITYNVARDLLPLVEQVTPGFDSPTVLPLEDARMVAVNALIKTSDMSDIMDKLYEIGARGIVVFNLTNTRL